MTSWRYGAAMKRRNTRATVYLNADLHKALKLKSVETDHSVSDLINEAEAKIVRGIWQRFVALRSTTELARELNRQGITTKAWTTQDGVFRPGRPITKQNLYKMLRNQIGRAHV